MLKKGVVVMTNINLQTQDSLYYSHVFLNDQTVKSTTSYNKILQVRLDLFNDLIRSFFPKVITFFTNYFKEGKQDNNSYYQYGLGLLVDILDVYNNEWKNKTSTLNILSRELNDRIIDKDTFEYLLKVVSYQEETTREILDKELTIDRVENVFNHLKDVPLYLKSDLEINKLPKSKTREHTIIKKRSKEQRIIVTKAYNLESDDEIYDIGA